MDETSTVMNLTQDQIAMLESSDTDKWLVPVIEIEGELGFEIPDVLMQTLELAPGDVLAWEKSDNGFYLRKVDG